jgi:hypothetical protein
VFLLFRQLRSSPGECRGAVRETSQGFKLLATEQRVGMSKQYASAATSLKPSKAPGEAIHARCDAIDGEGSAVMMGYSYWAGLDHAQELNTGTAAMRLGGTNCRSCRVGPGNFTPSLSQVGSRTGAPV